MNKVEEFKKIVNEMAQLYEKKNKNYGDSFGQLYQELGPIAGLVPLHNKLDRATNLVKGGKNDFESLEDTFKDLACYAIMNLIEIKAKEDEKPDSDENYKYKDYYEEYLNPKLHAKPCEHCTRRNTTYISTLTNSCRGCVFYDYDHLIVTSSTGKINGNLFTTTPISIEDDYRSSIKNEILNNSKGENNEKE